MALQAFAAIPGLFVDPDRFAAEQCAEWIRACLALHAELEPAVGGGTLERAHIPQPTFVRSAVHNLSSNESYVRVVLPQANDRQLSCEHFPKYGEEGHALCYFRGNANLPDFVRDGVTAPIRRSLEQAGLAVPDREPAWRLTLNFYKNVGGTVAGFPFHVDIPANGVVTMILNIQREALFQIARDEAVTDVRLPVGSLLVLSGESRYEWKHRVLPMTAVGTAPGEIERISIVLGIQ